MSVELTIAKSVRTAAAVPSERVLQTAALLTWNGKAENVPAAQKAFAHRARMNSLASQGEWSADLDIAA